MLKAKDNIFEPQNIFNFTYYHDSFSLSNIHWLTQKT